MRTIMAMWVGLLLCSQAVSASPWAVGFESRGKPRISIDELEQIMGVLGLSESQEVAARDLWERHRDEARSRGSEARRIERTIRGEEFTGDPEQRWRQRLRIETQLAAIADMQAARDVQFVEELGAMLTPEQLTELDSAIVVHVLMPEYRVQSIAAAGAVRLFIHLDAARARLQSQGLLDGAKSSLDEIEANWMGRIAASVRSLRAMTVKDARRRYRDDDGFVAINDDGSHSIVSSETPSTQAAIKRLKRHTLLIRELIQAQRAFAAQLQSVDPDSFAIFELYCLVDSVRFLPRRIDGSSAVRAVWKKLESEDGVAPALEDEDWGHLTALRSRMVSVEQLDLRCMELRAKVVGGDGDAARLAELTSDLDEARTKFVSELQAFLEILDARG